MLQAEKIHSKTPHYRWCVLFIWLFAIHCPAIAQGITSPIEQAKPEDSAVFPIPIQAPLLPNRQKAPAILTDIKLPSIYPATAKSSLAWRMVANRISASKFKIISNGLPGNNFISQSYDASYADCLLTLIRASSQLGFKLEDLQNDAGELLLSSPEQNQRLVFTVFEMPVGKTTVTAAGERSNSSQITKQIQSIFDATALLLNKQFKI